MAETADDIILQIRTEFAQTDAALTKVRGELAQLANSSRAASETSRSAAAQTGSAWSGLKQSFTEINSALGLARQGFQMIQRAYGAVVGDTVAYNKEIRNTAQNLGITTEETSRIIQAMDDFGISAESVSGALEMMVKRGVAPSIDELASLADQYNSIKDPVERAALMTEKLGRNWTVLTPALKMGGDAIRETAGKINESLIVTKAAEEASRRYEKAVDDLNDSVEGLGHTIGNRTIPLFTQLAEMFSQWFDDAPDTFESLALAARHVTDEILDLTGATAAVRKALANSANVPYDPAVIIEMERLKKGAEEAAAAVSSVTYAIKEMSTAQIGKQMLDDLEAVKDQMSPEQYEKQFRAITTGYLGVSREQADFSVDMSRLSQDLHDGKIGWDEYTQGMKDAQKAVENYNRTPPPQVSQEGNTPGRLLTKGGLTPLAHDGSLQGDEGRKHAGSLQQASSAAGDLAANTGNVVTNETALSEAMPLVNKALKAQQGTMDGLASSSPVAATAIGQVSDSIQNSGIQSELAIPKLEALQGQIDAMHGKDLAITVTVNGVPIGSGSGALSGSQSLGVGGGAVGDDGKPKGGGASGLDTIVPPGYNENYTVTASSGERVRITRPGQAETSTTTGSGGITIYGRTTIITGQEAKTNRRAQLKSARVR